MRIDRLECLAKKLLEHNDPTVSFRMDLWFDQDRCGTVCCAFGLATTIPEFQADGLIINDSGVPSFAGYHGIGGAIRFFEIEHSKAKALFDPFTYEKEDEFGWGCMAAWKIKEQMVVDRIRAIVDGTPMPYTHPGSMYS